MKQIAVYGHFGHKEAMRLCYAYECLKRAPKSGPVAHAMLALELIIMDHATASIEQLAEVYKKVPEDDMQKYFMPEL